MKLSVRVVTTREDVAVVSVEGELDLDNVALLDAVLLPLPGQGVRHVVVAADRLRFCDVCGLRVLASVHAIMAATGGSLVVAEPAPALRRLIALMRGPEPDGPAPVAPVPVIRVYATVDQAVRGVTGLPRPSLTVSESS
ncbi:STAS domain-containing protein [Streptosporangium sp. NPDC023615]|uniref:STAS domain-containing protein n=1 Tax=Streptosporangium sp. NPDC023615 TaxID=3154794 RepID=UPI0034466C06